MISLQSRGVSHSQSTGSGLSQVFGQADVVTQGFGTGSYPYSGDLLDFLIRLY